MGLTKDQLQAIQLIRNVFKYGGEKYDGKLSTAKENADEFTERTGMKAFVIRKNNRYDYVTDYYFKTYNYEGKIFYETQIDE